MPFLTQDEEELRKEQGAPQISGQSSVINAPMAPQKQGAPASSGQFKNIQTYLDVNKEQAKQMGQNIVGSAQQAAQEASSAQEAFKAAKPQETQGQTAETLTQSYYSNPNANKQEYQALKSTGGYSGPSSYLDMATYGTAQEKTQKAAEKVGQLQNQTGFEQAVAQQYSRPQYGQGAKRLDAALIRGEDSSKKEAEKTYQQWGNLQDLLNQSVNPVQQQIQKNLDTAYANKQLIGGPQGAEQQYIENLYNPIAQRAQDISTSNRDRIQQIQQELSGLNLNSKRLTELGLNSGDILYGTSLQNYLNINPYASDLKAGDIATEQERSNWSNLMNLINGQDSRLNQVTSNTSPYEFNKQAFQSARAENQQKYENVTKNQPSANVITLDTGSSGLGLPSTLQNAMNTMNLEELANAIQSGTIPTGYGGAFTPESGFGKQIIDQYNTIRNTFGANQVINASEIISTPEYNLPVTGGLKG